MAADHVTIAISLLFGAIASLLISLLAVPLIYYMTHAGRLEQPA
jgi:multidrug efflux pump subunit AcrB